MYIGQNGRNIYGWLKEHACVRTQICEEVNMKFRKKFPDELLEITFQLCVKWNLNKHCKQFFLD